MRLARGGAGREHKCARRSSLGVRTKPADPLASASSPAALGLTLQRSRLRAARRAPNSNLRSLSGIQHFVAFIRRFAGGPDDPTVRVVSPEVALEPGKLAAKRWIPARMPHAPHPLPLLRSSSTPVLLTTTPTHPTPTDLARPRRATGTLVPRLGRLPPWAYRRLFRRGCSASLTVTSSPSDDAWRGGQFT